MNKLIPEVYKGDIKLSSDAKWIHAPNARPAHWYVLRREFDVRIAPVWLAFGACHYAEVYVNGILVMRACERSYLFNIKYKAIDITPFVKEGKNALTVIMDKMFDENRASDIIVQIDCGEETVLTSDAGFKAHEYLPLAPNTSFFIEGPCKQEVFDARNDIFAPAFFVGFDDSAWENAEIESEDVVAYNFTSISQDKNRLQTNAPVFAKEYVSIGKSLPVGAKVMTLQTEGFAFCEALLTAGEDTEIIIHSFGGSTGASLDGKGIVYEDSIKLSKGQHRLAFIGKSPSFFIEGENAVADAWRCKELKPEIKPEGKRVKRTPRFPWNDLAGKAQLPEHFEQFLAEELYSTCRADFSPLTVSYRELDVHEDISRRKYDVNARDELGITGKESVFSKEGEMKIPPAKDDITFIIDFGTQRVGGIYLEAIAESGTQIQINAFEAIKGGEVVFVNPHNTMQYICKQGYNEYTSHLRRGFRYLLVNVPARESELVIKNLYLLEWRYPAESQTEFYCSDKRINEIYKMSIDTAKVCMLDAYVDCPGYEQNIWVGDARVTAMVNLMNFGCYDFNKRFLSLVADSVDEGLCRIYRKGNKRYIEGRYLPCASFPTYPEGNIPIWSYMWVISVYEHYMHSGDREALVGLLPAVKETFRRSVNMMSERGLLSINGAWNLIEWANNDICEYGECVANSMMLSYCFKLFSGVLAELGDTELAKEYADNAEKIKAAINEYAWNEERGAYIDTVRDETSYEKYLEYYREIGKTPFDYKTYLSLSRISVQTNTFAVLYGIAEGERREKALGLLAENIEKGIYIAGSPAYRTAGEPSEAEAPDGIVHIGSPFFMFFALDVLFKNGYSALALKSISREWGDMLDSGIATCTESFNSKTEWKTRSVAHSWSASPAVYLMSELLGIKPHSPGFREFSVEPCKCRLDFAKGSVPTPYGKIYVEWHRKENGEVEIICNAPEECRRVKNIL